MEPTNQQTSPILPIAIICGFAMIAIAIFFTNKDKATIVAPLQNNDEVASKEMRPVDETDNIRGNPNAQILMIEYSDYDCPFCKSYHATMNQVMDEYGITGKVAWVYRQFPIVQLHPNAPKISEAALCVDSIAGNDAFWKFTDLIYKERDLNEATNVTKLPQYAEESGVSKADYIACMSNGDMKEAVAKSIEDGFNSGARGTPYTILTVGNEKAIINGAQSYDVVKGIISNLIDQLDGKIDASKSTTSTSGVRTNENGVPLI